MSNLREEFEKLPEISERVDDGWISFRNGIYWNKCLQHGDDYLNGAWHAFQEQQKKIDAVLEFIDSDELGHDARLGDFYRDIKELLK